MTTERSVFYAHIAENDLHAPPTYTSQQPSEAGIIMSLESHFTHEEIRVSGSQVICWVRDIYSMCPLTTVPQSQHYVKPAL